MPTLQDALKRPEKDWSRSDPLSVLQQGTLQRPISADPFPMPTPERPLYRPTPNSRCPMPPTNTVNPDNIRQLFKSAVKAQRVLPPQIASNNQ